MHVSMYECVYICVYVVDVCQKKERMYENIHVYECMSWYLHGGMIDRIGSVPYPKHLGTLWLSEDRQGTFGSF